MYTEQEDGLVKLSTIEESKRLAAWTAVDHHIKEEHKVIGIGSGACILPNFFAVSNVDVTVETYPQKS